MPSTTFGHALNCACPAVFFAVSWTAAVVDTKESKCHFAQRAHNWICWQAEALQNCNRKNHPLSSNAFPYADFNLRCHHFCEVYHNAGPFMRDLEYVTRLCQWEWKLPPVWRGLLGWGRWPRRPAENSCNILKDPTKYFTDAGDSSFWSYLVH